MKSLDHATQIIDTSSLEIFNLSILREETRENASFYEFINVEEFLKTSLQRKYIKQPSVLSSRFNGI